MTRMANPLTIITLAGDEVAMGRQHGELVRELGGYEDAIAFYAALPERILGAGRRDRGRQLAVKALGPLVRAGLGRLDRARPAELRSRTEAFLRALGRPAAERQNVLVLDATQNAIGVLGRLGLMEDVGRLAMAGACSSFAYWGEASEDGRLLFARNFDLPGIGVWERWPTVVFCTPARGGGLRYGFVTTRGADVPGVTAFNEAGIVLSMHTRFHREVSFDGLGVVDLGHLIARRATSLADAVAIASEQRIASSWGVVIGSARERKAIALEVHAGRVAVRRPAQGASHLAVTNRNRVPVMRPGELAPSAAWVRYSDGREAVLERRLDGARGLGVEAAMALLGSHEAGDVPGWQRMTGDCPAQSISIQSVIVDPEREVILIGAGSAPTSKGPWIEVPWRWRDGPGCTIVNGDGAAERAIHPCDRGPGDEAYAHFVEAARLEAIRAPERDVEASLLRALALAPDDPSYRHLAGGLALRAGRPDDALAHLEAALETERSVFRQGELHRWASLAARWCDRGARAAVHRAALMANPEAALAAARRGIDRGLARRRHREIGVDFQLLGLSSP